MNLLISEISASSSFSLITLNTASQIFLSNSAACLPVMPSNSAEEDFTGRWIRLWKIHGSLNWMKKNGTSTSAERIVRIGKIDTPINELMIYPSKEKYNLSRKEPFIAYFDRMKRYLQRGELVFICSGYSFSDQHINDIIFNAMRQNKRLYVMVFCFSDDQLNEMSSYATAHRNLCVMSPKKIIANGIEKEWEYATSLLLIGALLTDSTNPNDDIFPAIILTKVPICPSL